VQPCASPFVSKGSDGVHGGAFRSIPEEEYVNDGTLPGRLASRKVHEGRVVKLSVDTVRFPDGSTGDLEMIRHPGAAAVLPVVGDVAEKDPEILLIHQYRYASGGMLWEVPAGLPLGPDEPWDDCAHRELEEETGFKATRLTYMTRILTTPGFTDEVIHLYVAEGLVKGEASLDDDEFVEVVRLRFSEALEMVRTGQIIDCKSIATLLFAAHYVLGRRVDGG
jgi:ADP-ribose pyrophosphatase